MLSRRTCKSLLADTMYIMLPSVLKQKLLSLDLYRPERVTFSDEADTTL